MNVYSRKKRFEKLLLCVLQPCPQSGDDLMLAYLFERKPIKDRHSLLQLMKKSPLKDKRYCSLHLFSKLIVSNYIQPPVPKNIDNLKYRILRSFDDIEFAHSRKRLYDAPFFNYCWLLSFFLDEFGLSEYKPFVKPLKCKHRRKVYATMYKELKNLNTLLPTLGGVLNSHTLFSGHDDGV